MTENERQITYIGIYYGSQQQAEDIALTRCQELADSYGKPYGVVIMNMGSREVSKGAAFPQTSGRIWGFSNFKGPKTMDWEKVFAQNPDLIGRAS